MRKQPWNEEKYCTRHPLEQLICRRCEQVKAGKATAKKHPGMAKEWGKLGGRPPRKTK